MRHILILLLIVGFAINQGEAQVDDRAAFQIGIKAGANLANVYDTDGEDFDADGKFGLVLGAFMSVPLGSTFGVQPEVLFSQKGFNAKGSLLGSAYSLTRTTSFIDVPIYFTIKPMSTLTLLVGPQFSFLTKQKDVFENSITSFEIEEEFKNENLRKNILGVSLGINLNISKIVLGARASWDLYNNHGDGTSTTPRYKNVWLQTTLGFRLF
jgi:hypothetical protein